MKNGRKVFCVVSHTHWDREWYMPLEWYRQKLVDLFDRLLATIGEHPDYIFHLDAQTVVLEDYLAVRPERKELLKQLIAKRRIVIGPFYLQNDFYLTGGESTVRNLLEGQKLCREFCGGSDVGYCADQFGNISQMPQILRGFGLDNFIFGRGVKNYHVDEQGNAVFEPTPTEFIWKGADGTAVLAIHMRHWYNNAQRFSADTEKALKLLSNISEAFDNEYTFTPYLLLMNGVDHLEAQSDLPEIIEKMQKHLPDGQDILQYDLSDYVHDVKDYINENGICLPEYTGELDHGEDIDRWLRGTYSSRHYLKVANVRAETLLENRLEPMYAMLEQYGMRGVYPADRFRYIWKNLLRNHPHDSVCGCSHDAVHAHMENRYAEIFEFADEQLDRCLSQAITHTDVCRNAAQDEYIITVANTLSKPLSGMVKVEMKLLVADGMENFAIFDAQGNPVDFLLLDRHRGVSNVYSPINLPGRLEVDYCTLYLDAGTVREYSFKNFIVRKAPDALPTAESIQSGWEISNEYYTVTVESDGVVTLKECATGRVISDLLAVEDRADAGDSYRFIDGKDQPLENDSFEKTVTVTENNRFAAEVRINYRMNLPAGYDFEQEKRTEESVLSTLILSLRLEKGKPYVILNYTVDNHSRDHRLRVVMNTDVCSNFHYADAPFDVCRRQNDFFPGTDAQTYPNTSFAALCADQQGFAVFTEGAHEYEHDENKLYFTLLRATGVITSGASENWLVPENQCLRQYGGRMAFCTFDGEPAEADLPFVAQSFRAPLIARATACDIKKFSGGRPCVQDSTIQELFYLPDEYPETFIADNTPALTVSGRGVVVTAFKQSEDQSGLILRLCNLSEETTAVEVRITGRIYQTELDEVRRRFLGRDRINEVLPPKKILTLYIGQNRH